MGGRVMLAARRASSRILGAVWLASNSRTTLACIGPQAPHDHALCGPCGTAPSRCELRKGFGSEATVPSDVTSSPLLKRYEHLLQSTKLRPNKSQEAAVHALALLQQYACSSGTPYLPDSHPGVMPTEADYITHGAKPEVPVEQPASGNESRGGSESLPEPPPICGAYLHGPVGSGKTMCMDIFFGTLPLPQSQCLQQQHSKVSTEHAVPPKPAPRKKQRLHFHDFMLRVHQRLHQLQQNRPRAVGKSRQGLPVYRYADVSHDPLDVVVWEVSSEIRVLCLDELHVTDVADAMILARLLEGLAYHGTLTVFTSNQPPHDLYKDGLSRKYFLPFISMIESTMAVLKISSKIDYRMSSKEGLQSGNSPEGMHLQPRGVALYGPHRESDLQCTWERETLGWHISSPQQVHAAYGRALWVPLGAHLPDEASTEGKNQTDWHIRKQAACMLTFEQLCGAVGLGSTESPVRSVLGASDYLALCRTFHTMYISGVPVLGPTELDEARRFVAFLDIAYEERVRLVLAASAPPRVLFAPLLEEAAQLGMDPTLGLATTQGIANLTEPTKAQVQSRGAARASSPQVRALLREQVLMYHRASSRLHELCAETL